MVNWWLIAVIVVAAIAAIIGLIYLFAYAFSLFKDFEEKDSDFPDPAEKVRVILTFPCRNFNRSEEIK